MYVFEKKTSNLDQRWEKILYSDGGRSRGIQQRLKPREGWPHVRSLTLLYIIFERKGNPFVYLILINRTPFTSQRGRRLKGKGKGIRARDHARGVSLPPSSHAPRVSLTPKTPFPKTPFLFPFKRLPRRLPFHMHS